MSVCKQIIIAVVGLVAIAVVAVAMIKYKIIPLRNIPIPSPECPLVLSKNFIYHQMKSGDMLLENLENGISCKVDRCYVREGSLVFLLIGENDRQPKAKSVIMFHASGSIERENSFEKIREIEDGMVRAGVEWFNNEKEVKKWISDKNGD